MEEIIEVNMTKPFKFDLGETVEMVMGRSCYAHFDKQKAVIIKRTRCPNGEEVYRMNPVDGDLQQNVQFPSGNLRKLVNGTAETLKPHHYRQLGRKMPIREE